MVDMENFNCENINFNWLGSSFKFVTYLHVVAPLEVLFERGPREGVGVLVHGGRGWCHDQHADRRARVMAKDRLNGAVVGEREALVAPAPVHDHPQGRPLLRERVCMSVNLVAYLLYFYTSF